MNYFISKLSLVILTLSILVTVSFHFFLECHTRIADHDEYWFITGGRQENLLIKQYDVFGVHPPLGLLIYKGLDKIGFKILEIRFVSTFFGIATLLVFFFWVSLWLGKIEAITSLAILSFSPLMLYISTWARFYSIFLFFLVLSFFFIELFSKNITRKYSLLYLCMAFIFFIIALLTEYSAIIVSPSFFLYCFLKLNKSSKRDFFFLLFGIAATFLISGFLFFYYRILVGKLGFSGPDSWLLFFNDWSLSWAYVSVFGKAATFFALFSVILILISKKNKEFKFVILSFLVTVIILRVFKLYPLDGTRHITYFAPFSALILMHLLITICRSKIVLTVFVAALIINDIYHMPSFKKVYSYRDRQKNFEEEVMKAFSSALEHTDTHHLVVELRLFPIIDYLFTKKNPDQRRHERKGVDSILIDNRVRVFYCSDGDFFFLNSEERIRACVNKLEQVLTKKKSFLIIKTLNKCFECGVELVFR